MSNYPDDMHLYDDDPRSPDYEERELIENDIAYCPKCDEEYTLPENTIRCPFCGSKEIGF